MSSRYSTMVLEDIIYDYANVRGDLTEEYARHQLLATIEERMHAAQARAWDQCVQYFSSNGVQPIFVALLDKAKEENPYG